MAWIHNRTTFSKLHSKSIISILFIFLFLFFGFPAYSDRVKKPIEKQRLIPSNFLEWGEGDPEYAILVDKSLQKIMLYHNDNLFEPEKVYFGSTGENDGPKNRVNDRKTPEGIYFFINNYEERYLSPIYGARALPIDYPNVVDKKDGKKGYGIWFHGTNKPIKPNDTNGCIALENKDIEEIASYVKLFETPIIISSKVEMVPPSEAERRSLEVKRIIEEWRKAWQGKDIEKYMSFYNSRFTAGNQNWDQWKKYKADLARKYRKINVDVDDIKILANDGVILVSFKQTYRTPSFESRGTKRLYLTRNSRNLKIIGEFFKGDEKSITPVIRPVSFDKKKIEDIIYSWKDTWEEKNLEAYISYYDDGFQSRNMNLSQWKDHRERLNQKYNAINITISNLMVKRISDNSASVSFIQDYRADDYSDYGAKTIKLLKRGDDWKIREEEWTPIKRKSRP